MGFWTDFKVIYGHIWGFQGLLGVFLGILGQIFVKNDFLSTN